MSETASKYARVQPTGDLPLADDPLNLEIIGAVPGTGAVRKTPTSSIRDASVAAAEVAAVAPAIEAGAAAGSAAALTAIVPAVTGAEQARDTAGVSAQAAEAQRAAAEERAAAAQMSAASAGLAAAQALTASPLYASTALGLAATEEGETFSVAGAGESFATLYRHTDGAAVAVASYPSTAAVTAIPAKKAPGPAAVMMRMRDRLGRLFAAIDLGGARFWAAGQQWTTEADGSRRWKRLDGAGAALSLRADGIATDGERVGVAGGALIGRPQGSQGGLVDWFRVTDRLGRGIVRMGLGHIVAGRLRLTSLPDGSAIFAGPRGALVAQGATGGPVMPGRLWDAPIAHPGAVLSIGSPSGRYTAFRINPANGYLQRIGSTDSGVGASDFSGTELASYAAEAAAYSEAVTRRVVDLHQPTAGMVLWIVYGQSLAAGWESWPALSLTTPPDCYMMGQSVHPNSETGSYWLPVGGSTALQPLVATVRDATEGLLTPEQVAALSFGASNTGETALEGFAAQFRPAWLRHRGKPDGDPANKWVFANCGVGGRRISTLTASANLVFQRIQDAIAACKALATAAGVTFSVGGILFNQGEADAVNLTPFSEYASDLTQCIADIRAEVATQTGQSGVLPIYLFQTGGQYAEDSSQLAIARAQVAVADAVPGVFVVANNQVVVDKGDHLTSNGTRWEGNLAGKVAIRTLIEGEGWDCTRTISWRVRGRTLVGLFHVPVAPVRFGVPYIGRAAAGTVNGTSRGIYVTDDAGAVPVSAVRVEQERLIVATLGRAVSGTVTVWLGRLAGTTGAIAICDSDRTRLASAYAYTPGTGQSADEEIAELVGLTYPSSNFALADVRSALAP
jgi:hypothetical protein